MNVRSGIWTKGVKSESKNIAILRPLELESDSIFFFDWSRRWKFLSVWSRTQSWSPKILGGRSWSRSRIFDAIFWLRLQPRYVLGKMKFLGKKCIFRAKNEFLGQKCFFWGKKCIILCKNFILWAKKIIYLQKICLAGVGVRFGVKNFGLWSRSQKFFVAWSQSWSRGQKFLRAWSQSWKFVCFESE